MAWALVAALFFADIAIWIITGFLRRDYSLSITFFTAFYVILAVTLLRAWRLRRDHEQVVPTRRTFTRLGWAWLWITLLSWGVNVVSSDGTMKATVFDLLIPASLAVMHLAVWGTAWSEKTWRRLVWVFAFILVVDIVISGLTVWLVNVTRTIPTIVFFVNARYPVILFSAAGRILVRTPGIFESGGTNGSFLLLASGPVLSYVLLSRQAFHRRTAAALTAVGLSLLIVATLTRRSVLGLGVLIAVLGGITALIRRRYVLAGLVATGVLAIAAVAVLALPGFFESHSLAARLDFWSQNLNNIAQLEPWRFLTGYGELQSSPDFAQNAGLALLDNGLISLMVYGGAAYLGAVLWYYAELLRLNLRLVQTLGEHARWLAAANVGLIITMFVIALFAVFFTNTTESFPYMIGINLVTRRLVEGGPHEVISAAAKAGD